MVFQHAIDAKGRTSMPARFRDALLSEGESRVIVTTAFDGCLHAYPLAAWEAFEDKLSQRSPTEPGIKQIYRFYVANASEIEIDKMGRILLPANLRSWARLEKEVVWATQNKKMELWSKTEWDKAQQEALSEVNRAAIENAFVSLGM